MMCWQLCNFALLRFRDLGEMMARQVAAIVPSFQMTEMACDTRRPVQCEFWRWVGKAGKATFSALLCNFERGKAS